MLYLYCQLDGETMILEYSITNTFSIRDKQTISFEGVKDDETNDIHTKEIDGKKILKFACFYGANASGKTNIINALDYYLDFVINSFTELKPEESTYFDPFRFDESSASKPGEFNILFYAPDYNDTRRLVKYTYDLVIDSRKVLFESLYYSPKGQAKLIFKREWDKEIKWGTDIKGAKKVISELARDNCSLIGAGAQANHPVFTLIYSYFRKRLQSPLIRNYLGGIGNYQLKMIEDNKDLKDKIVGLIQAADFGSITDIEIESKDFPDDFFEDMPDSMKKAFQESVEKPKMRNAFLVHSYNGRSYRLPIRKESNGTQKVFELANILVYATASADLLVDEIDSSLHSDIVETLLHLFLLLSDDSQLIFTTHNQDLLDSGILRDDEVWFCYKTDEGNSTYNSITDYTGIRKDVSRKKLYKAGRFGSLPFIDIEKLRELFCAEKD